MTAELRVGGLVRRFPGAPHPVLDGVDLVVPAGGCVAVLGPSGSGKSTLLRLVAGLDTPDAGRVDLGGRPLDGLPPERRRVGLVFQRPRLFRHLDVRDNVAFPLEVAGRRRRAARVEAERFLALTGAGTLAGRAVHHLSGGQEQRVALARALAARPDVLLLDEPFAALDPPARTAMHELIAELRRRVAPTLVLVTHDRHEAAVLADTVAVLVGGRIAQHDTAAAVHTRPATLAVHAFLDGRNAVPGEVTAGRHRSPLGRLVLPAAAGTPRDGPGVLVVRQEVLRLVAEESSEADAVGTVTEVRPLGARAAVRVAIDTPDGAHGRPGRDGVVVEAHVPVEPVPHRRGLRVGVVVPLEHRHVVHPEAGTEAAGTEAAGTEAPPTAAGSPTGGGCRGGMMQAIWNGVVLAESEDTTVVEGNHYFPRDSLREEYFTATAHTSTCPWKGRASYFTIRVGQAVLTDAAWTYPAPKPAAEPIRDRVAFWKDVEVVPSGGGAPGAGPGTGQAGLVGRIARRLIARPRDRRESA